MKKIIYFIVVSLSFMSAVQAGEQGTYIKASEIGTLTGWIELTWFERDWVSEDTSYEYSGEWRSIRSYDNFNQCITYVFDPHLPMISVDGDVRLKCKVQRPKKPHRVQGFFQYGVAGAKRVRLHVPHKHLWGLEGLHEILGYERIEEMYAQGNHLTDVSLLSSLSHLTKLWLSDNALTELPKGLASLTNLKKLCLDTNKLVDVSALAALVNLEDKLCLRTNKVSDASFLRHLTKLKRLDLSDNPLKKIKQEWLETCSELNEIIVDDDVQIPLEWCQRDPEHSCASTLTLVPRTCTCPYSDGSFAWKRDHKDDCAKHVPVRIVRLAESRCFMQVPCSAVEDIAKVRDGLWLVEGADSYLVTPYCLPYILEQVDC